MTITDKINNAIESTSHDTEPYTDTSDGFTHQTYSGLQEDVENALEYDGYDLNKVSQSVVNEYVFNLI